eukprot:9965355-Ditylum_brightwellii.AAC.1
MSSISFSSDDTFEDWGERLEGKIDLDVYMDSEVHAMQRENTSVKLLLKAHRTIFEDAKHTLIMTLHHSVRKYNPPMSKNCTSND